MQECLPDLFCFDDCGDFGGRGIREIGQAVGPLTAVRAALEAGSGGACTSHSAREENVISCMICSMC